ncbi:transposase [Streptomyces microflavus]|uniref:transposase n=1 Tax=Streptomyces microflavus TaxID=1919 RepID=UPI00382DDD6A
MGSKYTKRYTAEFKRDAIALVDSSGKTVTAVARELGILTFNRSEQQRWLRAVYVARLGRPGMSDEMKADLWRRCGQGSRSASSRDRSTNRPALCSPPSSTTEE